MGLTSQQVHRIGGAAFALVALALLANHAGVWRAEWLSWLLPALLMGYGAESFADLWVHGSAKPLDYGPESRQHLIQGASVLTAGIVEGLRLTGRLQDMVWGWVLPAALIVVGAVFWLHKQHGVNGSSMAMMVMKVQHRAFAVSLWVAAAARALAVLPNPHTSGFALAWLLLLLVFGLQLLLYTEQAGAMKHAG